jgi:LacI family transcriptional regulator
MADGVSVIDVARRAGVSVGTVSNVLNRPDRVSPPTRTRVLDAITELGFVRNEAARQLRAGRSRMIGLLVLDVRNPFFTDVAAGVEAAAAEAGLSVILCNSGDDDKRESHYLSLLQEQRAYGILMTPVLDDNPQVRELRRRGTAVVFVDRGASGQQCSASVDDVAGGELATTHLIEQGHRRIAFVGGPVSLNQVHDRLDGARRAVRLAGLSESTITVIETPGLTVQAGLRTGERIAAMPARRRPTAAFCANDLLALGLLQDLTKRGRRVPDDLAIIGYDDIDFAEAAAVPLTSIRQPRSQLGRAAAQLLIEEVSAPESHRHRQVVFQPDLVIRASTRS